ncbi:zinc ribbon-containing protein [Heliophilum fasciatum]|uniref:Zinc ribbon family protein n=1 Tax=Heliophilum fasciatum TaxID=35700 RepID=A0A4R2RYP3_9FIRM|nr:zinc ribbon-containing protein [Heliophilum fasciatum]MCW2277166.1 DNA-directed RNA polymerase subunit RPC12/RpoP [Heliophilum fasciatum]TCP68199.1 zinc ribbon family protein [Heliophilum fasciatum]
MAKTGEKPAAGTYKCTKCRFKITVDGATELPICPLCKFDEYVKVD